MIVLRKWTKTKFDGYHWREKRYKMYLLFGLIPLFISING